MTSLSIRLTVPLREVITRDALRQHTAVARALREQHTYTPSQGALEASSSHHLVAKLACTCLLRTPARTYARAHVSIGMACSHAWLKGGRRGSDTGGVQRVQRGRRRAKLPSLTHAGRPASRPAQNEVAQHSSAVQYFCTGSSERRRRTDRRVLRSEGAGLHTSNAQGCSKMQMGGT